MTAETLQKADADSNAELASNEPTFHWSEIFGLRTAGVIYALVVLLIVLVVFSWMEGRPFYLRPANLANLLEQTSLLGIVAIGMALLLISGSFDLSVGSAAALAAIVSALATNAYGPYVGVAAGVATGAAGGLFNGCLHWYIGLNPFIVTLGTLSAYRGLALVVSDGRTVVIESPQHEEFLHTYFGGHMGAPNALLLAGVVTIICVLIAAHFNGAKTSRNLGLGIGAALIVASVFIDYDVRLSISAVVWLGLTFVTWLALSFTTYGRRLRATGANMNAARVAGVRIQYYKIMPFVIVGALAGLAGALIVARLGAVDPNVFTAAELTVIASAVVGGVSLFGGIGSVIKTACGAFLLFAINNGLNMLNISSNYQLLVAGVVILASASLYVISERKSRGG